MMIVAMCINVLFLVLNIVLFLMITSKGKTIRVVRNTTISDEKKKFKQIETELVRQKNRAEKADKAKGTFLANMSHEIRTPLNGIIGLTELVLDTSLNHNQLELIRAIELESEALLFLVNDILDVSKIESGKMSIESIDFNLRSMINDLLVPFRLNAAKKQIRITANIGPEIPEYLIGDPGRLRQIITNLISNAIKFTEKGTISLSAHLRAQGKDESLGVLFKIQDTGIGIAPDKLKVLFNSFTQADESTTRKYGGTGLGTTIAKQLVELMGGTIDIDSRLNEGTTVRFSVILKKSVENPLPAIPIYSLSGIRILLVNSNPVFSDDLKAYFLNKGCLVSHAETAGDGLALFTANSFQLVITESFLSDMDGFRLAEKCKTLNKNVPLILLASASSKGDAETCRQTGINAYLARPFNKREICIAAETLLGLPGNPDQQASSLITRHSISENFKYTLKILILDTNNDTRKETTQFFIANNYTIESADTSEKALALFSQNDYDLIFIFSHPVKPGEHNIIHQLRQIETTKPETDFLPSVIIVINTAGQCEAIRDICPQNSINEFLITPIDPTILIKKTGKWAQLRHQQIRPTEDHTSADPNIMKDTNQPVHPFNPAAKILVVEDTPINQKVLLKMLKTDGYETDLAINGRQGVTAFEKKRYDVVLMDMQMPVMDGYEAIRVIRDIEKQTKVTPTPIIAITANAMTKDRQKCLEAGADDYYSKPLTKKNIQSIMQQWLKNQRT